MREVINGTVFVNGIMCDSFGRPITVKNGYSSEDEESAIEAYEEAKKSSPLPTKQETLKPAKQENQETVKENKKQKGLVRIKSNNTTYKPFVIKKFVKKMTLEDEVLYEVMINGDLIIPKYRNNTLCNEEGNEISIENGYCDEDVEYAKKAFEKYSKTL